jgi:molecular chaperone DnaK (HSP70)
VVRIGLDFGTTRIVVAAADRGNYPLVNFEAPGGRVHDWFPSVLAVANGRRVYGWGALELQGEPGWTIARSLKRLLKDAGPQTEIEVGGQVLNLTQIIAEMMAVLRHELINSSTLGAGKSDRLEAVLGVPANANSNQRFLTEEAARAGGFEVLGLSNEPSAAAVEYAYRTSEERKSLSRGGLLVYDLGGGTLDVSLVAMGEEEHEVLVSDGMPDFGGDDFDEILAALALTAAKVSVAEPLAATERYTLRDECREKKEALNPNSRKILIDLERVRDGWKEISIPVDEFYEKCRPLIERSRHVAENLLAAHPDQPIDTLYLTGGGSELPPVARILRETFGRRVRRSAYMRSATAIGLAIRASSQDDRVLRDRFTQNFGVWRESDGGANVTFDVIFPRGARLTRRGEDPQQIVRKYNPAHNIGHFRYLECSHLDERGQPQGEISNWDEIRVAYDPQLRGREDLTAVAVERRWPRGDVLIEEEYTCDASGGVKVRISDKLADFASEYRLGKWSMQPKPARPSKANL